MSPGKVDSHSRGLLFLPHRNDIFMKLYLFIVGYTWYSRLNPVSAISLSQISCIHVTSNSMRVTHVPFVTTNVTFELLQRAGREENYSQNRYLLMFSDPSQKTQRPIPPDFVCKHICKRDYNTKTVSQNWTWVEPVMKRYFLLLWLGLTWNKASAWA